MTHLSILRSFTLAHHERQAYGVSSNLSKNHSRSLTPGLFSLASIWGKSRALVQTIIRRNQTRILFVWDSAGTFFGSLTTAYQAKAELDVAYTVIRPHSALGCTFALPSDYLEDFNSFYFTEKGAPCNRFMGEFNSRTPQLNTALDEKKNKEGLEC